MEKLVKGDVIVLHFPFSDLSGMKKRPAIVIATLYGKDIICCQVTSMNVFDKYSISLNDTEFEQGALKQISRIRPNKLFTADSNIILYKIGSLTREKTKEVENAVIDILST